MYMPSQPTSTKVEKAILAARIATQTRLTGLIAGTLLETPTGWRPIERLMQGDELYTYDGGLRAIARLERQSIEASKAAPEGLVHISGGVLSNSDDLLVLPDQKLLIETAALGGVATLVRAVDLVGQAGVSLLRSDHHLQIVRPIFDTEEVLWANAGLLFQCAAPAEQPGFFPTARPRALPAIFAHQVVTGPSLAA